MLISPREKAASNTVSYADSFCGGGGSSLGARNAIERAGFRFDLIAAINHDPRAIATHELAHPDMAGRHYCTGVDAINLLKVFPYGYDIHWFSPSCQEHSYCKRGKSIDVQSRASAWHVVNVARMRRPKRMIVENVPPFVKWQEAFDANGDPIRSRSGETFREWESALKSLGYTMEWRILNCADYGVPQSRPRFFAFLRCDGKAIVWPPPTHDRFGRNGLPRWRGASDILDPSLRGRSLYRLDGKRLSDKTMERIIEGLKRYTLPAIAPMLGPDVVSSFIVPLRNHSRPRGLDEPIPTVTASSGHQLYLAQAALRPYFVAHFGERPGQAPRTRSDQEPFWTVTGRGAGDLVIPTLERFTLGQHGGSIARLATDPLATITTKGYLRVFEAFLTPVEHDRHNHRPIVSDRDGNLWQFDLTYRPLTVQELAGGQSFPSTYQFAGSATQAKRMVGNAVPPDLAEQLVSAQLHDRITTQLQKAG